MIEHIKMKLGDEEIAISGENRPRAMEEAAEILRKGGFTQKGRPHMTEDGPYNPYNGWPNYETWDVKLWIDNDRQLYQETQELVMEAEGRAGAVDALMELLVALNPLAEDANTFSDLMTHALGQVDWFRIADSIAEEIGREW